MNKYIFAGIFFIASLAHANISSSIPEGALASNPAYSSIKSDAYIGTGSTVTVVAGTGAGTIGTPSASVAGTNFAGQLTVITATTPGIASTIATVTASVSMPTKMICILFPANAVTALVSGATMVLVTETASTWTVTSGATGLTGASTYIWNYLCGGY